MTVAGDKSGGAVLDDGDVCRAHGAVPSVEVGREAGAEVHSGGPAFVDAYCEVALAVLFKGDAVVAGDASGNVGAAAQGVFGEVAHAIAVVVTIGYCCTCSKEQAGPLLKGDAGASTIGDKRGGDFFFGCGGLADNADASFFGTPLDGSLEVISGGGGPGPAGFAKEAPLTTAVEDPDPALLTSGVDAVVVGHGEGAVIPTVLRIVERARGTVPVLFPLSGVLRSGNKARGKRTEFDDGIVTEGRAGAGVVSAINGGTKPDLGGLQAQGGGHAGGGEQG